MEAFNNFDVKETIKPNYGFTLKKQEVEKDEKFEPYFDFAYNFSARKTNTYIPHVDERILLDKKSIDFGRKESFTNPLTNLNIPFKARSSSITCSYACESLEYIIAEMGNEENIELSLTTLRVNKEKRIADFILIVSKDRKSVV